MKIASFNWKALVFLAVGVVLGGVAVALGIGLLALNQVRNDGISVTARVIATETRPGSRGRTNYLVRYEFTPSDKQAEIYPGETAVGWDEKHRWEEAKTTGRITVRYLPADPAVNYWDVYLEDKVSSTRLLLLFCTLIALLCILVGVFSLRMSREKFEHWMSRRWWE
jgi:hypothetical protein